MSSWYFLWYFMKGYFFYNSNLFLHHSGIHYRGGKKGVVNIFNFEKAGILEKGALILGWANGSLLIILNSLEIQLLMWSWSSIILIKLFELLKSQRSFHFKRLNLTAFCNLMSDLSFEAIFISNIILSRCHLSFLPLFCI